MTWTLTRKLTKRAVATTLAAALALTTATAAPARASDDKAAAIAAASFFALVAAGIIAASRNKDRQGQAYDARPHVDRTKLLPAQCRFDLHQGHDRGSWYASPCLRNSFAWSGRLPDHCEALVDIPGRKRDLRAYDAQCLARYGYRSTAGHTAYR